MDPEIIAELQAIGAKLDTQNAALAAHQAAEVVWYAQMLFMAQAQAIALGIIWGCISWRLIVLAKQQRNPFW